MESSQKSGIGLKVGLGILLVLFLGTAFYASKLYSDKQLLAHCRDSALNSVQHLAADKVVKEWLAVDGQNTSSSPEVVLQES